MNCLINSNEESYFFVITLYNLVLHATFNFVDVELRAFVCFRARGVKTKNTLQFGGSVYYTVQFSSICNF